MTVMRVIGVFSKQSVCLNFTLLGFRTSVFSSLLVGSVLTLA